MLTLAIESSCDDTCAAVIKNRDMVLSNIVSNQFEVHAQFGGIVPELASRCHIESIWPVVQAALEKASTTLEDIDLIAATRGPGLVGSLLVGFTFAKALGLAKNIPCVGVDHMAGHLLSAFLCDTKPAFPYVALVVSGGNSSLFEVTDPLSYKQLGRTRDDAAGEAFDKIAKLLKLGYPGGPVVSQYAENGNPEAIKFPRSWLDPDKFDFSFSGLKTSVVNHVNKLQQKNQTIPIADICASFQQAVIDVLVEKSIKAVQASNYHTLVIGGGVASNKQLRQQLQKRCQQENISLFTPPPVYCTDNAAMIGLAGYYQHAKGNTVAPDTDVYPRSPLH